VSGTRVELGCHALLKNTGTQATKRCFVHRGWDGLPSSQHTRRTVLALEAADALPELDGLKANLFSGEQEAAADALPELDRLKAYTTLYLLERHFAADALPELDGLKVPEL
jgi:hypothetical protein